MFAVIVVAGKDETDLCNLLEIANRWFKTLQGMTHPLQLKEMLASMTRTKPFSFRFVILSSCSHVRSAGLCG